MVVVTFLVKGDAISEFGKSNTIILIVTIQLRKLFPQAGATEPSKKVYLKFILLFSYRHLGIIMEN